MRAKYILEMRQTLMYRWPKSTLLNEVLTESAKKPLLKYQSRPHFKSTLSARKQQNQNQNCNEIVGTKDDEAKFKLKVINNDG